MNIVIIHSIPYDFVNYDFFIDHHLHRVTYIGFPSALLNIPYHIKCEKIECKKNKLHEVFLACEHSRADAIIAIHEGDMLIAANIRDRLGIVGDRTEDIILHCEKIKMKKSISSAGISVPKNMYLDQLSEENLSSLEGRVIIKPVSSTASQGVETFENTIALWDFLNERNFLSTNNLVFEVEEFVNGEIVHFDGIMINGKSTPIIESKYINTVPEYRLGKPQASYQLNPVSQGDQEWVESCLNAVGIKNTPFHLEAIRSPKRGLVFLEVAGRPPGGGAVFSYKLSTGENMFHHALSHSMETGEVESKVVLNRNISTIKRDNLFYSISIFPGHHLKSREYKIVGADDILKDEKIIYAHNRDKKITLTENIEFLHDLIPLAIYARADSESEIAAFTMKIVNEIKVMP